MRSMAMPAAQTPGGGGGGRGSGGSGGGGSASCGDPDAWLLTVMRKENNRAMLAALENALAVFVADAAKQTLSFPPKGVFYRRVCRAVALRYHLACHVEPVAGVASAESGPMRLVLVKTPDSAVPAKRLAELVQGSDGPVASLGAAICATGTSRAASAAPTTVARQPGALLDATPLNAGASPTGAVPSGQDAEILPDPEPAARPSAVLRRPSNDPNARNGVRASGSSSSAGPGAVKNITEEEYETARARIFQKGAESVSRDGDAHADGVLRDAAGGGPSSGVHLRIAQGPVDGSIGFTRKREQRAPGAAPHRPPPANDVTSGHSGATQIPGHGGLSAEARRSADTAAQRSDRQDPDFDRRYSKWQAPPAAVPILPLYGTHPPPFAFHLQPSVSAILQHKHDLARQSMMRLAMPHPPAGQSLSSDSAPGPVPSVPVYVPMLGAHHPMFGHPPPPPLAHLPGALRDGRGMVAVPPYPTPFRPTQGGTGGQQVPSMWLPPHTPHGQGWQAQAPPIEPHIARSSGILRPLPVAHVRDEAPVPQAAAYGLNSLTDFPSLSDGKSKP